MKIEHARTNFRNKLTGTFIGRSLFNKMKNGNLQQLDGLRSDETENSKKETEVDFGLYFNAKA